MNVILFESADRDRLLPLCYTRPVALLRTGILSLKEKWERRLPANYSFQTVSYLQEKYPLNLAEVNLLINSHVCPTDALVEQVRALEPMQGLKWQELPIAVFLPKAEAENYPAAAETIHWIDYQEALDVVNDPWDINELASRQIKLDFELLTAGRTSAPLSDTNRVIAPENVFVEEGAKLEFAIINASQGPVYIGNHAEVMEGCLIRGPLALGEHAVLNMGTKVYGPVALGPYCKVGGEIANSTLLGYSNKGHDGFLGHSVLGEWCNLGAGTNVSNLKNTYDQVKVWSYKDERFIRTGLQFCGLIMGDHSKAGINTMINTGTVVGVGCNIHGTGFPRQFVPSFSDGGAHGYKVHQLKPMFKTATQVMSRRKSSLSDVDERILTAIFDRSARFRKF